MTICVAGISKQDSSIVVASDKMLTSTPLGSFEMDFEKYIEFSNSVLLFAGNATNQEKIHEKLKEKFSKDDKKVYMKQLVSALEDIVFELRSELINEFLSRYDLNIKEAKNLIPSPIQNPLNDKILKVLDRASIENQIMVAGFDEKGEPKIFGLDAVENVIQFKFVDYSGIGMHAIGSGSIQTLNSLLFAKFSKKLTTPEVVYHLYTAKKRAEVAQGVGKATDLFMFTKSKGLEQIDGGQVMEYYKKQLKSGEKILIEFVEKWGVEHK